MVIHVLPCLITSRPYHTHIRTPTRTRDPEYANGSTIGAGADTQTGMTDSTTTQPGALPEDLPGPLEPLSVAMMNEMDASNRQARLDRLKAESSPWHSLYGQ